MKTKEEVDAYLAGVRKTVDRARALVEQASLRIAETDRFLAKQGLTREQVAKFCFTPAQIALANEELARRGLPPLDAEVVSALDAPPPAPAEEAVAPSGDVVQERARKFGAMMQGLQ